MMSIIIILASAQSNESSLLDRCRRSLTVVESTERVDAGLAGVNISVTKKKVHFEIP